MALNLVSISTINPRLVAANQMRYDFQQLGFRGFLCSKKFQELKLPLSPSSRNHSSMFCSTALGSDVSEDTDDMFDDMFEKYGKVVFTRTDQKPTTAEVDDDAESLSWFMKIKVDEGKGMAAVAGEGDDGGARGCRLAGRGVDGDSGAVGGRQAGRGSGKGRRIWRHMEGDSGAVGGVAVAMAKVASDVKAEDIKVLFVKPLVYWTRFFIIATAFSRPQLYAIRTKMADLAEEKFGRVPNGDSKPNSWTLLDFGDVVVHLFLPPQRAFYNLEEFYGNATLIELPFEDEKPFRRMALLKIENGLNRVLYDKLSEEAPRDVVGGQTIN
ncbi:hypothetical protein KSS87_021496 [Heliosperma pusillum]|nr:hypothetical protein KSS87_021496 [Heliosperma pusillum]